MKSNKNRGVGRPAYSVKWPNRKFTMQDLMVANGVNPKTGKGKLCTKLTLVKALQRDMFMADPTTGKPDTDRPRRTSLIVRVKDETREPNSKSGLGRKTFVYIRRDKLANVTKVAPDAKSPAPKDTMSYESHKAALLTPAVNIAPEPTPAAVTETVPAAETVSEVTAPTAPAVAETVTA